MNTLQITAIVFLSLVGLFAWTEAGAWWIDRLHRRHVRLNGNSCFWPRWYHALPCGPIVWLITFVGWWAGEREANEQPDPQARPAPRFTHKQQLNESAHFHFPSHPHSP